MAPLLYVSITFSVLELQYAEVMRKSGVGLPILTSHTFVQRHKPHLPRKMSGEALNLISKSIYMRVQSFIPFGSRLMVLW